MDVWTTTGILFVPQTGFTVIYGETCMKVPQSLGGALYLTQNNYNLVNQLFVNHYSSAADCTGL